MHCVSGDAVSKGLCVPTVKPVETRQCNGSVCDKYHWTVGNWTEVRADSHIDPNGKLRTT